MFQRFQLAQGDSNVEDEHHVLIIYNVLDTVKDVNLGGEIKGQATMLIICVSPRSTVTLTFSSSLLTGRKFAL